MSTISNDNSFLVKHGAQISGVLSCFDRVIFRGYLPLSYPKGMEGYLYQQKIPLKQFQDYAPKVAEQIKEHVKAEVEKAGAPYRHLPTKEPMEQLARERVAKENIREGIVCGFSQLETCRTFRFEYRDRRPRLRADYRKYLVQYVFVMHAVLGLIHVKIHTWFPLTMQVYVNGHDYLAKKLDGLGMKYTQADNAFTALDNPQAAQACADRFAKLKWPKLLGELAQRFNPLVGRSLRQQDYYWVMDQAEYATDVLFREPSALAGLYPRLVEHARRCFTAEDVLKFLGRKLHPCFRGEVQTHVGRRIEGVRIKHRMKSNKLKMYDKAGRVLRIETTINDPKEFRVWRSKMSKDYGKTGPSRGPMSWLPLCKGVGWMWKYAEVSRQSNERYLTALAVVDDDSQARRLLDRVTQSSQFAGRRKRALQPLSAADQALFLAAMRGEHRLRGFRNQELAVHLYPKPPRDRAERRRRCAQVTRSIQLLRAHGLVAKIQNTRRYRITEQGEQVMSAAITVKELHFPKQLSQAA